jgi:hypothetical protein
MATKGSIHPGGVGGEGEGKKKSVKKYANAGDDKLEKLLASRSSYTKIKLSLCCTACHGREGIDREQTKNTIKSLQWKNANAGHNENKLFSACYRNDQTKLFKKLLLRRRRRGRRKRDKHEISFQPQTKTRKEKKRTPKNTADDNNDNKIHRKEPGGVS